MRKKVRSRPRKRRLLRRAKKHVKKHTKKHLKKHSRKRRHHRHLKKTSKPKLTEPVLFVKDVLPLHRLKFSSFDTIQEAIKLFSKYRVSGAPVFSGKKILGIITQESIADFVDKEGVSEVVEHDKNAPVSNMMTKTIFSIAPESSVTDAIEFMDEKGINQLLVLDKKKNFLGVISRQEILSKIASMLVLQDKKPSIEIQTNIDDFYLKLVEKGSASAKYFSDQLNVSKEIIEEWAKALQEHGLVEVVYSPFGEMEVKIKKRLKE